MQCDVTCSRLFAYTQVYLHIESSISRQGRVTNLQKFYHRNYTINLDDVKDEKL